VQFFSRNMWICNLRINNSFFRICGLEYLRICGFAIEERAQEFADLQICGLLKKVCLPNLCIQIWTIVSRQKNPSNYKYMVLCVAQLIEAE
jgi:hypothetical protein